MTMRLKATPQVVQDYQKLFVKRRAYTMQSLRPIRTLLFTLPLAPIAQNDYYDYNSLNLGGNS